MQRQPRMMRRKTTRQAPTRPRRTREEVEASLRARADDLTVRIGRLKQELGRLGAEMRKAKKGSGTESFYKKRALRVVKQKRELERRLARTMDMLHEMGKARDLSEEAELNEEVRQIVKSQEEMTVEDVERLIEEMRDNMENIDEVGQVLQADMLVAGEAEGWDEEEMERQLEEEVRNMNLGEGGSAGVGQGVGETEESLNEFIRDLEVRLPEAHDGSVQEYQAPKKNEGSADQGKKKKNSREVRGTGK